jgi:hypothetical protein
MHSLYLNNTGFERFCNFVDSLRRSQNKEISFPFYVGSSPHPSTEKMIVRIFLCFVCRVERGSEARKTPMRTRKYRITTRSARCGLVQSLRDWKKVRAMVITSPQIETSASERGEEARAAGAGEEMEARKPRREATNWKGVAAAQTEKALGDLSLVLSPKTI